MAPVVSIAERLGELLARSIATAVGPGRDPDPKLQRSDRVDWQANGVLALAHETGSNPRDLAARVVAAMPDDDLVERCEVSGPGFVNLTVADAAITAQVGRRAEDPRLGVPAFSQPRTTVIDYSQPNIAKEMHVGHL